MLAKRSPKTPIVTTNTSSPGDNVFTAAASIPPVPAGENKKVVFSLINGLQVVGDSGLKSMVFSAAVIKSFAWTLLPGPLAGAESDRGYVTVPYFLSFY